MSKIFCQNCGAPNDDADKFCASCGSKMVIPVTAANLSQPQTAQIQNQPSGYNNSYQNYNQNYNQSYQNYQNYQNYANQNSAYHIDPNDLAVFVGAENNGYYMQKYTEMNMSNSKNSWNWAAFLISAPWMLYRKMYKNALIYMGGILLISLALPYFSIALPILSGIFGNHFYFKHAEEKLKSASMMSGYEKNMFISREGGTNVGAAIGITIAFVFVECIIIGLLAALGIGYYRYYY